MGGCSKKSSVLPDSTFFPPFFFRAHTRETKKTGQQSHLKRLRTLLTTFDLQVSLQNDKFWGAQVCMGAARSLDPHIGIFFLHSMVMNS